MLLLRLLQYTARSISTDVGQVIELDMQHMLTTGLGAAQVSSFNRFFEAYTALNSALPDGQVLPDGVMGARLTTVMRGLGEEIQHGLPEKNSGHDCGSNKGR